MQGPTGRCRASANGSEAEAWDARDGVVRRELLATLFYDIHISQGRVKGYTPNADGQRSAN